MRPPTSSSSRSSVPFIRPSSCRLRPVIISLSPSRSRPPRTGAAVGVERLAQRLVERVDPELAAVHGREDLDVADRIEVVVGRQALADQRDDLVQRRRGPTGARSGTGRGACRSPAANSGVSPRRIACAPWTIMLPAAWRKMWVSRVVGTSSEATSSANGLPAPTGAS